GFGAVILALSLPGALVSCGRLADFVDPAWRPVVHFAFAYGVVAAGLHMAHLVRARLRGTAFRVFVSLPGQTFTAAGFMAGWWLLALLPIRLALGALGWNDVLEALRWLDLAPFALTVFSVGTSLRPAEEWVRIFLGGPGPEEFQRIPVQRTRRRAPDPPSGRPLRVVQITDPHLGPWQPVARLQRHIERLVDHDPDLVLLTGDFLTMEAEGTPGALAESLSPLRRLSTRCFAIFGNHDHSAPEEVKSALAHNGIRLLMDEEVIVDSPIGPVQILGADYVGRGRREHIEGLLARHPRREDHLRLLLLHDPLGFRHVPDGAVDLTLSGHTHGGQVGLLSLGFDWTVLSRSRWPDHGLFGLGANRLYVHRGTGFYGFPLRVGVPGELSVLELVPEP
ncbi:MAG: metallophosphoesterase, partial [Proteobacteria bacterium]|nr:metallophosphoesterase [Pseudomonadota bacterium]